MRDPNEYRGITLAPVVYKIYCSVLNARMTAWCERNDILCDEQNGFRKGRSTIDHISTLTSIIESRKLARKQTFAAFIDFNKAYDRIDRSLLWSSLKKIGVRGNMLNAVRSLYRNVQCTVRINNNDSQWFPVRRGLRQGCVLSPLLFNIYINDLVELIKDSGLGVNLGVEKVSVLAYADDLVLLADNEDDMNSMLAIINCWCNSNKMVVNPSKSKIVHFRGPSTSRTSSQFLCGDVELTISDSYAYLGVLLTEHLDYNLMAKAATKSATRALGLLIVKYKSIGGMPTNVYNKLYDAMVWSVINYSAGIWGTSERSTVNAVHHRALRFLLGIGKYAPNAAVNGECGVDPPVVRQWTAVARHWSRMKNMPERRLNKRVFSWAENNKKKNWNHRVNVYLKKINFDSLRNCTLPIEKGLFVKAVSTASLSLYIEEWKTKLARETAVHGNGRNKLQVYRNIKATYSSEHYLNLPLNRNHRSAYVKFRCGIAPLRIETGRYENVPHNERFCFNCPGFMEDEFHVLFKCPLYQQIRQHLFSTCYTKLPLLSTFSEYDQFLSLLSNTDIIYYVAKACHDILQLRREVLYKK